MRKLLAVATVLLAAGCNFKNHTFPGTDPRWASVDYQILGPTSAEACGTYILGIDFGHLFADQQGGSSGGGGGDALSMILGMLPIGGPSPEAGRAMYDALEKMPEASHLMAPKVHETITGIAPFKMPLFAQRCAQIEARGAKIGRGPVPNAH